MAMLIYWRVYFSYLFLLLSEVSPVEHAHKTLLKVVAVILWNGSGRFQKRLGQVT